MRGAGLGAALASLALAAPAGAQELSEALFLDELPGVLTASRLAQPLMDAPSAMTVIDRAMIEASGFREIPDLLRLVPGFYVGYFTGNQPIVANALVHDLTRYMQVQVDGRSVYLPTIGGVLWSALPLSMEDIERIEVTRGPNSASHGANSFTGIINIVTRHPDDVEPRTLRLLAGKQGARIGTFRWSGGGEVMRHRVTLEYREDDGFDDRSDDLRAPMLSYRGELDLGPRDAVSLQFGHVGGDRGAGFVEVAFDQPHKQKVNSHYQQMDWWRRTEGWGELRFKLYHNHTETRETTYNKAFSEYGITVPGGQFYEMNMLADRWDAEIQHTLVPAEGWRAVWGASWRQDEVRSRFYFGSGARLRNRSQTLFGHLEGRLAPSWLINAGAMLEHHDIGGDSISPRLSLHWQPSASHAFRASVSEARRYPVQFEENASNYATFNVQWAPGVLVPMTFGLYKANGDLKPEELHASELGYVGNWPRLNASLDARLFHWKLKGLIDRVPGPRPWDIANRHEATLRGFDMQLKWRPTEVTGLMVNYAYLHSAGSDKDIAESAPRQLAGLLLSQRLGHGVEAHLAYYRTSAFHGLGRASALPDTRRVDAKLSLPLKHQGMKGELALVLQNLGGDYKDFKKENTFPRRGHVQFRLEL